MKQIFTTILIFGTFLFGIEMKASCFRFDIFTIDSLPQLEEYDFIAHIKILDEQVYKMPPNCDGMATGILTIKIIELFKGKNISQILVPDYPYSCVNDNGEKLFRTSTNSLGVSKGEEWILFGKTLIDGKITIQYCDRNIRYKKSDEYNSSYVLRQLRKLYQHSTMNDENGNKQE